MRIRLDIDAVPPSTNEYMGKGSKRVQIKEYQAEKKFWSDMIWALKLQLPGDVLILLPLREATVITVYHFTNRHRRDPDNYAGKMIHDGLVDAGILAEDSFAHIDPFPLHRYGAERERTEIYIADGLRIRKMAEDIIKP